MKSRGVFYEQMKNSRTATFQLEEMQNVIKKHRTGNQVSQPATIVIAKNFSLPNYYNFAVKQIVNVV